MPEQQFDADARVAADESNLGAIDVIVVNYRTAELVQTLVSSLLSQATERLGQLVVIDNQPGTLSRQLPQDARLAYAARTNEGYAPGVNAGWRASLSPYVLLLNPDAAIDWSAVEGLADVLDREPGVGAVAPVHTDGHGVPTNPYHALPNWLDLLAHRTRLRRTTWAQERLARYLVAELDQGVPRDALVPVEQPPASCLLLRRAALGDDPMDERFPLFFNDVDLSRRLLAGGWSTVVTAAATCRHDPGTSTRSLRGRMSAENHVGAYRYVKKWDGRVQAMLFRAAVLLDQALSYLRVAEGERLALRETISALLADRSIFDARDGSDPVASADRPQR